MSQHVKIVFSETFQTEKASEVHFLSASGGVDNVIIVAAATTRIEHPISGSVDRDAVGIHNPPHRRCHTKRLLLHRKAKKKVLLHISCLGVDLIAKTDELALLNEKIKNVQEQADGAKTEELVLTHYKRLAALEEQKATLMKAAVPGAC
jgi:hypothetical protein